MIVSKATCGLCKPGKKVKRNNTKLKSIFLNAVYKDELSVNLIKSYEKKFGYN